MDLGNETSIDECVTTWDAKELAVDYNPRRWNTVLPSRTEFVDSRSVRAGYNKPAICTSPSHKEAKWIADQLNFAASVKRSASIFEQSEKNIMDYIKFCRAVFSALNHNKTPSPI